VKYQEEELARAVPSENNRLNIVRVISEWVGSRVEFFLLKGIPFDAFEGLSKLLEGFDFINNDY
jgi:hypothetical protein